MKYICSDISFTCRRDDHQFYSWVDYVICSSAISTTISNITSLLILLTTFLTTFQCYSLWIAILFRHILDLFWLVRQINKQISNRPFSGGVVTGVNRRPQAFLHLDYRRLTPVCHTPKKVYIPTKILQISIQLFLASIHVHHKLICGPNLHGVFYGDLSQLSCLTAYAIKLWLLHSFLPFNSPHWFSFGEIAASSVRAWGLESEEGGGNREMWKRRKSSRGMCYVPNYYAT